MLNIPTEIAEQILERETAISTMAGNLADWFGGERSLPEEHTGAMVLEPKYVESLLDGINQKYLEIVALTNGWEMPNG
jgi:hypothetical protein